MGTSLKKEKEGKNSSQNDSYGQAEIQAKSERLNMITGLGSLRIKQLPQPTARQYALTGLARKQLLPDKQVQTVRRNGHGAHDKDAAKNSKEQASFHASTLSGLKSFTLPAFCFGFLLPQGRHFAPHPARILSGFQPLSR